MKGITTSVDGAALHLCPAGCRDRDRRALLTTPADSAPGGRSRRRLIAASSPHVRSARRGRRGGVGEIDIPVFRLYRQTRVDCPRRRVAAHRLRSGDCLQDLRCCAVMPMSRPSDAQQRGRLPIRQPGVADRLVAAALVAAEQCSTRKVNQIVFAGRTGRGAMPAGNSERSDALHAAGQIEHGLECANDRMGSVRHLDLDRAGRLGDRIVARWP